MLIEPAATAAALRAAAGSGALRSALAGLDVELVVLFGSALDGAAPRDVDVAVGFHPGVSGDPLAVLDAVAAVAPGDHIDLLDLDRAGPVARVESLTKGVVLLETTPGAFTRRQMFAMGEYVETAYLREALLRDLAS